MPRRIDLHCDQLLASYLAGMTTVLLARRYGCSPTTIAKRLRACGGQLRSSRFQAVALSEDVLRRLYLDERWTIAAIAEHFGVSPSTVGNKRRALGMPARPRRRA